MAHFIITNNRVGISTQTPEIKLKDSLSRITFKADNKQRKEGKFGFDIVTKQLLSDCTDPEKLKTEYTPFKIERKTKDKSGNEKTIAVDYYVPWVSLSKDQTIVLDAEVDSIIGKVAGKIDSIEGNENGNIGLNFLDKNDSKTEVLKQIKKIELTCKNTNETPTNLRFKVGEDIIGGLNIFHPAQKEVDVRIVLVTVEDPKQIKSKKSKLSKEIADIINKIGVKKLN